MPDHSLNPETDRKVDFVIAGTQKGGTTALDYYLRKHPGIGMADSKEVHFFDNEEYFQHAPPPYSVYHAYFTRNRSRKLLGEATPIYMYWRHAPRRIWEYNPGMKIIVILRNPIERAYSHWNMERERHADSLTFREAIQREPERCREALPQQHRVYSYLDRGFYVEQLLRIWTFFPRSQTLVLKTSDLREKPQATMAEVCRFLGLDPLGPFEPLEIHSRKYGSAMQDREREYLRRVFEGEIRNLERLLGWDCSDWLSDAAAAPRIPDGPR